MRIASPIWRDQAGATIVEFALIAPFLMMTLFGMLDIGHAMYTRALLQGAIEKAARDSTIEAALTGPLDTRVTNIVRQIVPGADVTFSRKSYTNFSHATVPEDFADSNGNNACDNNESFEDANGNGTWDRDRGREGNGGARDAIAYKVTVTYPRLFPIGALIGQSNTTKMTAVSILRNQPFSMQTGGMTMGNCP